MTPDSLRRRAFKSSDRRLAREFRNRPFILDAILIQLRNYMSSNVMSNAPVMEDGRKKFFPGGWLWRTHMGVLTIEALGKIGIAKKLVPVDFPDRHMLESYASMDEVDVEINDFVVYIAGSQKSVAVGVVPVANTGEDQVASMKHGFIEAAMEVRPDSTSAHLVNGWKERAVGIEVIDAWKKDLIGKKVRMVMGLYDREKKEFIPGVEPEDKQERAVRVYLEDVAVGYISKDTLGRITEDTVGVVQDGGQFHLVVCW